MNALPKSITFEQSESIDAFFSAEKDLIITGNSTYSIELVRPLAQINVGTTGTLMQASFMAKSAPDTFYPFMNTVSGSTDYTWNFSNTTTETFSVNNEEYNYLVIGYLFAPVAGKKIATELTLTDSEQNSKMVEFSQVEIEANKRSNIVGNFTEE